MSNFFQDFYKNKIVFLDGATGSNLASAGMPSGVCPELWISEHKEVFLALQRAYVEAGSNILYAPTFGGNRIKLAEYGLEKELVSLNRNLVMLSKEAAEGKALVAGDITMTGKQLAPMGDMKFETLVDIYKEQISVLAEAGCDLLVVETMMSLQETRAAVLAAKECCDLPVMATLSFEPDGKTLFGTDAVTAALVLEGLGVDAVGVNCSAGPDTMVSLVKDMFQAVSIPIIAKPNAGMPFLDENGKTAYSMQPEEFGEKCKELLNAGASILGGCCGTTPAHIKALTDCCKNRVPVPAVHRNKRVLTSERKSLFFGLNDAFLVVGERINPTGKKAFQASLREGSMDMVEDFALSQDACGADILDVNMGMGGIDEKELLLKALETVQSVSNLPLSIDSSNVDAIEAALRIYPGRALINSVSLEGDKPERIFPLAKKYGAMCILLPLSDKGLPDSPEEKKSIIETLLEKAFSYGLALNDLVVDGLVTTVSANPSAALETLDTIRFCKEKGLATVCGLSNISFGLPERKNVNTAFLTMAIREGLTMAIANPSQTELMNAIYATDMLLNKENGAIRYIDYVTANQKEEGEKTLQSQEENLQDKLRKAVLKGNEGQSLEVVKFLHEEGNIKDDEILNQILLPAINEVGELFNKGKYFLPQLIAGANAMKAAIEYLEPFLASSGNAEETGVVVIATVKGDIHDIGKNLVALMLKNHGYRVIDLGKDVPTEEIIRVAKEEKADIIALSALMTTTMTEMQKVILSAREAGLTAKIMVGGAVVTQEYADEILADGYSGDAADAVRVAGNMLKSF